MPTQAQVLAHQAYQGIPRLDSPVIDLGTGYWVPSWYRFIIILWQKEGGSFTTLQGATVLQNNGGVLSALNALSGQWNGTIGTSASPGGAAVPQTRGASPFVFTATRSGSLVVFAAEAELSRDNGVTYYAVTLTGGAIPVLNGDKVRVTWFTAVAPKVTFFPNS